MRWILCAALALVLSPAFAADAQPRGTRPPVAENGDRRGADNDRDGRSEPVHVKGYYRKDGTYVRGHYRAEPKK